MIITREKFESLTNEEFNNLMLEFNKKYYQKFTIGVDGVITIEFEDGFTFYTHRKITDSNIKDCYPTKELLFMTKEEIINEINNRRVKDAFVKDRRAYFREYWTEGKEFCKNRYTDWNLSPDGTVSI